MKFSDRRRFFGSLAATIPLLCSALNAFARAGGGEGFGGDSGGGGSFGGSFGSGGAGDGIDIGPLVSLYFKLLFRFPLFVGPLSLVVGWYVWRLFRKYGEVRINSTIERGLTRQKTQIIQNDLTKLREADPQFDEQAFLARVNKAFLIVQQAWSDQNLTRARPFISQGVVDRFSSQIADQKSRGLINRMSQVNVLSSRVLEARVGRSYQSISVAITATALDEMISTDNTVVRSQNGSFTEIWTFLRRPGAVTVLRDGLMEGHCPSCGNALEIADGVQCRSCKTWVNSGEHDWVLVEITQQSEWAPENPPQGAWQEILNGDPQLSIEILEDRASSAFWRWVEAKRKNDPLPLKAVASPEFLSRLDLGAFYIQDAAVGSVKTIVFEKTDSVERVHVWVKWEGEVIHRNASGPLSQGRVRRSHFLIYQRVIGVTTKSLSGLGTYRCPSCGASPETYEVGQCAHCQTNFNDGKNDWALVDIVPSTQWVSPLSIQSMPWDQHFSPIDVVTILATALTADKAINEKEREILLEFSRRRGVDPVKTEAILSSCADGAVGLPEPKTTEEGIQMIRGLIQMSQADGRVSPDERILLISVGQKFRLKETDILQLIYKEGAALLARTKMARKN